jgi:hypothetical protein
MAEKIYYQTRRGRCPFAALVTAVDPDAPPILQWDLPDNRNPVSWYLYEGGSDHAEFGLLQGRHEVTAIALQPNQWTSEDQFAHQGAGVFFAILGCHDTHNRTLCLFPEILRSEFHDVRSVIEAYSRQTPIEGRMEAMCAGIMIQKRPTATIAEELVIVASGQTVAYIIDRFD